MLIVTKQIRPRRRLSRSLACGLALLLLATPFLTAQDDAANEVSEGDALGDGNPAPRLPLAEAIRVALESNLALKSQRLSPEIQEENITIQEADFDPSLFTQANLRQSELAWNEADGDFRQSVSDSRSYVAGVTKRVATGAQVTASASHSRSDGSSFNSDLNQFVGGGLSERASVELDVTQPLLRNRGSDVNLAPLRSARSQERAARYELHNTAADLLQATELAYWELADAYARRRLRQSNVELSSRILSEAQERERLGLATRLEVLQAEANLAQSNEEIIRADRAISEAADGLLATMGVLDEATVLTTAPEVQALPEPAKSTPDFEYVLQNALARNFDTAIQEEILAQLEQERLLAKNQTRPELDVSLSAAYDGLSPHSARDAFSEAFDRRGDNWGLGLSFSLPWGRRASKANLRQTDIRIDQAAYQLAAIKQDLLRSTRSAWRTLTISREQLRAAELVVELQEATYAQEQGRFEEGLSTVRDLLETQRDLDTAALGLLDAQLTAIQAEIELARVQGEMLERHNVEWGLIYHQPLPQRSEEGVQ